MTQAERASFLYRIGVETKEHIDALRTLIEDTIDDQKLEVDDDEMEEAVEFMDKKLEQYGACI